VRPVAWRRTQFRQAGLRGRVTKRQAAEGEPVPVGPVRQSERPPRGRPSLDEILLEEIARVVKVKVGDNVVKIDKERALIRGLRDLAVEGDVKAARLVIDLRTRL